MSFQKSRARKYSLFFLFAIIVSPVILTPIEAMVVVLDGRPDFYLGTAYFPSIRIKENLLNSYLEKICTEFGYCGFRVKVFRWSWRFRIRSLITKWSHPVAFVTYSPFPIIFAWDKTMLSFTKEEWRAILLHEIGHKTQVKYYDEFAMDCFSASLMGKEATVSVQQKITQYYVTSPQEKTYRRERIQYLYSPMCPS